MWPTPRFNNAHFMADCPLCFPNHLPIWRVCRSSRIIPFHLQMLSWLYRYKEEPTIYWSALCASVFFMWKNWEPQIANLWKHLCICEWQFTSFSLILELWSIYKANISLIISSTPKLFNFSGRRFCANIISEILRHMGNLGANELGNKNTI